MAYQRYQPHLSLQRSPRDWQDIHVTVESRSVYDVTHLLWKASIGSTTVDINAEDLYGWTPLHLACAAENSQLYQSHQISRRPKSYPAPPREGPKETELSLEILRILIDHGADVNARALGSCTPLHCAASSGWLQHVEVLISAGAKLHTGPQCSPLCWVKGGSAGNHPVAIYLRIQLGSEGLKLIDDDHKSHGSNAGSGTPPKSRSSGPTVERGKCTRDLSTKSVSPSPELPVQSLRFRPRSPLGPESSPNYLCPRCALISMESLRSKSGHVHGSTIGDLIENSSECRLCKIMISAFGEDVSCQYESQVSQVILRTSNGHHAGCKEPDIIRTLDIKLAYGCSCDKPYSPPPCQERRAALGSPIWVRKESGITDGPSPHLDDCAGCDNTVIEVSVEIYTEKGKVMVVTGVNIDHYPVSQRSLNTIRSWLERCEHNHPICGSFWSFPTSPSRLIEVNDTDEDQIRLVRPGPLDDYLALSHRWVTGLQPNWVTKEENLQRRHTWFSLRCLPATIKDAIVVTKSLGFKWLWIDSLCIVQDSEDDWAVESSNMASIYANASATIFADSAESDDEGFLLARQVRPQTEISLLKNGESSERMSVLVRQTTDGEFRWDKACAFRENFNSSPLSDRGWVFQERVISPRIIHFERDQIYWECNETTLAEDGHVISNGSRATRECGESSPASTKMMYAETMARGGHTSRPNTDLHTDSRWTQSMEQWSTIVSGYNDLVLTRPHDKLPALSGLASIFSQGLRDRTYIAGLWKEELPFGLDWANTSKGSRELGPRYSERAPSFSWASIDGPVSPKARSGNLSAKVKWHISILGHNVHPITSDPFGKIKQGASLTISGELCDGTTLGPLPERWGTLAKGSIPLYDSEMSCVGHMMPDCAESLPAMGVSFLRLFEEYPYGTEYFLVLSPASGFNNTRPAYQRLGIASVLVQEDKKRSDMFEGVESCIFDLV